MFTIKLFFRPMKDAPAESIPILQETFEAKSYKIYHALDDMQLVTPDREIFLTNEDCFQAIIENSFGKTTDIIKAIEPPAG